jgi:hypothetical protein
MATFSQQFLANLGGAGGMLQGAADLGGAIGGVPGQMKEKRKADAFNVLMSQAQKAMAENNPVELGRISQELAKKGYPEQAAKLTEAFKVATKKQQNIAAGKAALSENFTQMSAGAKTLAGEGRLNEAIELDDRAKEIAKRKGRNALSIYSSKTGIDLSDNRAQEGFFRIANAYGLQDEAKGLLDDYLGVSDKTTFGTEITIRDSQNNKFTRRIAYDKKGNPREIITPIGNSPAEPIGEITVISGTTGASAFDKPDIAAETELETEFAKLRTEALGSLPGLESSLSTAQQSLDLLDKIKTGGVTTAMIRGAQSFLGNQPQDEAEFQFYAGKAVLDGLENFTGAISEGERKYLENLYYSLERSGFANKAILETLVTQFATAIENAQLRADSTSFSDYNTKIKSRREKSNKTKTQRAVSFSSQPKG